MQLSHGWNTEQHVSFSPLRSRVPHSPLVAAFISSPSVAKECFRSLRSNLSTRLR